VYALGQEQRGEGARGTRPTVRRSNRQDLSAPAVAWLHADDLVPGLTAERLLLKISSRWRDEPPHAERRFER